jgi:biotin carboxylase
MVFVESNTTGSGRLFCANARRMGLRPVVLGVDPGRYSYVEGDGFDSVVVEAATVPAVLAACGGLGGRIAGVISSSEYHSGTAAAVARELGLPHADPEAIRACRDKQVQRTILHNAGMPGPAFAAARTAEDAAEKANAIGYPVVVKPVAGSGSIGARLCRTESEVRAAAGFVLDTDPAELALPAQERVMVEEFLDGPEFSVETLDGRPVAVVAKHLGPAPHFVEIGHDVPANTEHADVLGEAAVEALTALGLIWGAAHVELRLTTGGPRIVEVNPRLAGGMIPRMIEEATGVDLIAEVVARAAGRQAPEHPARNAAASIRFLVAPSEGRLDGIDGVEAARATPGVVDVGLTRKPGELLARTNSFRDRIGYVIAAAPDVGRSSRVAEEALRQLTPRITPDEISVAIVGLGSRGLGVLERVITLAPQGSRVRVEVIDPRCDGAGVHHLDQPDYLLLNTTCAQVSLFPDRLSVGDTTGEPGPSLHDWVTARGLRIGQDGFTVSTTGREIRPTDFLPRRVLGEYLGWFSHTIRQRAPERVTITPHRAEAAGLDEDGDELVITLSTNEVIRARHAFLTTGYTPNTTRAEPRRVSDPYPVPDTMDDIRPGETVAMAGFGLSSMDLISALTVGRGGRFAEPEDEPRYLPSGAEPVILLYSRTGIPCRARPKVVEFGEPYQPLVFTAENIDRIRAGGTGPLDFDRDVLPLVLNEIRAAYRRCEARLAGRARQLDEAFATTTDLTALLDELDAKHGPVDAAALFDGSAEMPLDSSLTYQKWLADVIRADLAEGLLGFTGSPVKAGLDILRALRDTFRYVVDFGGLTPESLDAYTAHTIPALNRAVVGPQFERHTELLALIAAGIVAAPFGPAPAVRRNERTGGWTVSSTTLAEPCTREVDWLVSAHVDLPAVTTSASPLLRALSARGWIRPHRPESRLVHGIDIDPDQHPIRGNGEVERRIWVLGPLCEGATFYNNLVPSPSVYSRPIADAHRCVTAMYATGPGA